MDMRIKKISSQLGSRLSDPGAHMAHAAVLILRHRRRRKKETGSLGRQDSQDPPKESKNPFPFESPYDGV